MYKHDHLANTTAALWYIFKTYISSETSLTNFVYILFAVSGLVVISVVVLSLLVIGLVVVNCIKYMYLDCQEE